MKSSTFLLFLTVFVGYTCFGSLSETEKGNVQDIEYYLREDDNVQATADINELYIITQNLKHEILNLKNKFDQERRETTLLVKHLQSEIMLKERQHTKEISQMKGELAEVRKTMDDVNKPEELSRRKEKMMSLELETLKQRCQALTGSFCLQTISTLYTCDPRLMHIVSKGGKIRNRYNQLPHLTQDTNGKVTN